jgi:hypothetical protein
VEINAYLKKLILEARKDPGLQKINSAFAKNIKAMFEKPCQITGLWFNYQNKVDIQAFYITHNPQHMDLETYIIGPLHLNPNQKYNPFEKYFTKKNLFRYVDFQYNIDHYVNDFIGVLRKLEISNYFYTLKEYEHFIFNYGWLKNNIFFMTSIKKLQDRKISSPLSKFKEHIQIREEYREIDPPPMESNIDHFLGWQIDLDMWIGPKLQYDFNDRIEGNLIENFIQCEIKTTYSNQKLEIDSDGYCRLYFGKKKPTLSQQYQIIPKINDLLAIFLINEYYLPQISIEDIYPGKKRIKINKDIQNKTTMRAFDNLIKYYYPLDVKDFREEYCYEVDFSKFHFISKEKIHEMIYSANLIKQHPKLYSMITLLQESFTNLRKKNYNTSYILSMALLEQFICQIWKDELEKLKQANTIENEAYKIKKKKFSITEKIGDLLSWGRITKEQEKVLKKIVRFRNKFLHELKPVNRDLTREVFYTALKGIKSEFKKRKII